MSLGTRGGGKNYDTSVEIAMPISIRVKAIDINTTLTLH